MQISTTFGVLKKHEFERFACSITLTLEYFYPKYGDE